MSTWLTTVKGKNPDILMVAGYLGDLILATKQAKELNVNPKAIFMTAGPVYAQYTKALGKTAEGITTASWWADTLGYKGPVVGTPDDFGKMWMKITGNEADYVAAASTAAGVMYQLAIEKVGSLDKKKIRDALAAHGRHDLLRPGQVQQERTEHRQHRARHPDPEWEAAPRFSQGYGPGRLPVSQAEVLSLPACPRPAQGRGRAASSSPNPWAAHWKE